jgi:hypothetical protein
VVDARFGATTPRPGAARPWRSWPAIVVRIAGLPLPCRSADAPARCGQLSISRVRDPGAPRR